MNKEKIKANDVLICIILPFVAAAFLVEFIVLQYYYSSEILWSYVIYILLMMIHDVECHNS
jgi:hypothetical protein